MLYNTRLDGEHQCVCVCLPEYLIQMGTFYAIIKMSSYPISSTKHRCCVCVFVYAITLFALFHQIMPTWSKHELSHIRYGGMERDRETTRHTHTQDLFRLRVRLRLRLCKHPAIFATHSVANEMFSQFTCPFSPTRTFSFDFSNRTFSNKNSSSSNNKKIRVPLLNIICSIFSLLIKLIYHQAPYKRANVVICHIHSSI